MKEAILNGVRRSLQFRYFASTSLKRHVASSIRFNFPIAAIQSYNDVLLDIPTFQVVT